MLPLAVLSACAAVLAIPASAAPLPFDPSSELQQPAVTLVASPEQAYAADTLHTSGSAPGRVRRGADFREADYAVNVATAFKTAVPTQATPAVLTAASPTSAALSRRSGFTHGSGYSDDKAQQHYGEVIVPAAYAATPSPVALVDLASVPDSDSSTEEPSQPAVDMAGFHKAFVTPLVQPDAPAGGPGPETRPQFNQANQTLSQSQLDDGAPITLPPPLSGSTALAQVGAASVPVVTVNKAAGDALPQVNGPGAAPGSYSSRPALQYKIGTVDAKSQSKSKSRYGRRGPLRLSQHLSGSSLYTGSDPYSQPVNVYPRAAGSLPVVKPAPRAAIALVKKSFSAPAPAPDVDLERRQAANVAPNVPVDAQVPSPLVATRRTGRVSSKAPMDAPPERRQANVAPNVPVSARVPSPLVATRRTRVSKARTDAAPDMDLERRQANVAPNVPVNAQVPSPLVATRRTGRVSSKAPMDAAPEQSDKAQSLNTNRGVQGVGKHAHLSVEA